MTEKTLAQFAEENAAAMAASIAALEPWMAEAQVALDQMLAELDIDRSIRDLEELVSQPVSAASISRPSQDS